MIHDNGMKSQVISVQQVADILHVKYQTAYRMVRDGELHGFRVGRLWRVQVSELDKLMKGDATTEATNETIQG